jgi:prepilin-type N-terminal cleavage/methylation domain-containing protein
VGVQLGEGTVVETRCPPRGFTIVEILMVVVLIGLIAGFAIPRLNLGAYRVNGGARSLTALLARAQRLAVTSQYDVNVLFDTDSNSVRVHEDADNDNAIDNNERVRRYPLGDGVVFGLGGAPQRPAGAGPVTFTRQLGGVPELIFRRDGSASENGAIYITTPNALEAGRAKDARSIEVVRATGRPQWYTYTGTAWVRKF